MNLHETSPQDWLAHADCVCSEQDIQSAISRLAQEITAELAEQNPLVYVVMNGGLIFAGQLLPQLRFPLELAYLHATRYGMETSGTTLEWKVHPRFDVKGRAVLLLDDILDEGHTLVAIQQHLQELGAARIYTAVLSDKQHTRKAQPGLRADFTGVEVPDRFLFGCGMDVRGYWRNLPAIYALAGS